MTEAQSTDNARSRNKDVLNIYIDKEVATKLREEATKECRTVSGQIEFMLKAWYGHEP